jgi:hypothetical protein
MSFCTSPVLTGELTKASEALTPSAEYKSCGANLKMNGCEFTFHPASESINGTFDIGGTKCSGVSGQQMAPIVILPQSGLAATFENEGSGSSATVKIHAQVTGLKYEVTEGTYKGTYSNGTYATTWSVKGEHSGTSTGLKTVSYPGFSVIGEGKGRVFHSDLYPVKIGGEQITGTVGEKTLEKHLITTSAGTIVCDTVTFASFPEEGLYEDIGELTLAPTYNSCRSAGVNAVVTPEPGCYDDFNITGFFPESLGLCQVEVTSASCVITILPQIHPGLTFANLGTGSSAQVEVKAKISGLEYRLKGVGGKKCPNKVSDGLYSNGTYEGVTALKVAKVL